MHGDNACLQTALSCNNDVGKVGTEEAGPKQQAAAMFMRAVPPEQNSCHSASPLQAERDLGARAQRRRINMCNPSTCRWRLGTGPPQQAPPMRRQATSGQGGSSAAGRRASRRPPPPPPTPKPQSRLPRQIAQRRGRVQTMRKIGNRPRRLCHRRLRGSRRRTRARSRVWAACARRSIIGRLARARTCAVV